jgi:serine/threonine protein kinase
VSDVIDLPLAAFEVSAFFVIVLDYAKEGDLAMDYKKAKRESPGLSPLLPFTPLLSTLAKVHCDVKPQKILVHSQAVFRLTDFGDARSVRRRRKGA